ncbi:MAG: non-canonical purine NTP diphosphatase [Mangrovibacterium sp.]
MKLVFATNNLNKLKEVQAMLDDSIELLSLSDINCHEDIPETQPTIEGNARQKAQYIYNNYGFNCFADDTGLEIDALHGEPGVYSARYAGEAKDSKANMQKVLAKLKDEKNRTAQFKTVFALIIDGEETLFEGIVKGEILSHECGSDGFGYDPIFKAEGFDKSFAEISLQEKNKVSHRARATRKLIEWLGANARS